MSLSPKSVDSSLSPVSNSLPDQTSTQPSSPPSQISSDMAERTDDTSRKSETGSLAVNKNDDVWDDMDGKAKALTNLLKTSSVSKPGLKVDLCKLIVLRSRSLWPSWRTR